MGRLRLSNRIALSTQVRYDTLVDELQYVTTADSAGEPRYLLGRIDQRNWTFTFRTNLAVTPDLTLQYYGSPFISTGRYSAFKRGTNTLAESYADRFHIFGPEEISARPDGTAFTVAEAGGGRFSFDNPDFSFREFRSNLVLRWEYKPGSSLYVVWSEGRTGEEPFAESRFRRNWGGLWRARPDDVFLVKISYWFSP